MKPNPPSIPRPRHRELRIRPVAKNKQKAKRLYALEASKFIAESLADPHRGYCPIMLTFGRNVLVTQVHHMRGRVGPLLIDRRFWLAVSAEGHTWIHANPQLACKQGWLAPIGKWNTPPRDSETDRLRSLISLRKQTKAKAKIT